LPDRPNILLVVLDTVRSDVVAPYTPEAVTPFIADLAKGSLVFERAFSTSDWTLPAHASILTGQLVSAHGVNYNVGYDNLRGRPTLASRLRDAGYRTWGLSNNPWFSSLTSLDEGFDRFEAYRPRERRSLVPVNFFKDRVYDNFERAPPGLLKRLVLAYEWTVKARVDDGCGRAFRGLLDLVDGGGGGPWFAMVNVIEAHGHFIPPQPFRDRWVGDVPMGRLLAINQDAYNYHFGRASMTPGDFDALFRLYKAEVAYLDHMLEGLLGALGRRGQLEDTLVVVTSDHGENFGEHGLMEHRWCVYDTLIRVPLVVRLPATHRDLADGVDTGRPVSLTDLLPTLARFGGLEVHSDDGVTGTDLLSGETDHVLAEMVPRQLPVKALPKEAWERFSHIKVARRTRRGKVIWSSDGRHELFDLVADPGEERNALSGEDDLDPAVSGELSGLADALASQRVAVAAEARVASEEMRSRLRALGYLS
jgi:arylsulfatase A-like enzyme